MVRQLTVSRLATVLVAGVMLAASGGVRAQTDTDPAKSPLLAQDDLHYIGAFEVDPSDGSDAKEGTLAWGGRALGVNSDAHTLLMSGHDWYNRLCEVAIPDDFSRGTRVVQACSDVAEGRLKDIDHNADVRLGGSLIYKGRLILSAYVYYDADGSQEKSHFVSGLNLAQTGDVQGPFRVGKEEAGFVSGYMGLVPQEWQEPFGGSALTGNCCIPIIARTSSGPALSVFDPDELGKESSVPAKELLGYPLDNPIADPETINPYFTRADFIGGVAFPTGSRSVLFVGRHGSGKPCYGEPGACQDRAGKYKGEHAYPYVHQVWAYDANDLLAVKRGKDRPWEPKPYATWRLSEMNDSGDATVAGAAYDPATRRLYITQEYGDHPKVHVYEIGKK